MMRFVICSKSTSPLLILIYLLSSKAGSHYSLLHKKIFNTKTLRHNNGTVRLNNNTLATVPVFDTKHMIISLLTDPSVMNKKNFAEGYNVLTGEVDDRPANKKYGEVTLVMHGFLQGIGTVKTRLTCLLD
jgi:hypothetical protein